MIGSSEKGPHEFVTTHWSLVGAAQSDDASRSLSMRALEELCRAYWYPLYSFVRRRGYNATDAQDLTQSFFARFIESEGFASADKERGRFRTYLLGAVKHFLANEWHRGRRKKRGGEFVFLEWECLDPEARYSATSVQMEDPDMGFDRQWALALIERAKERLSVEMTSKGQAALFEALKGCLGGQEPPREETMERLGMTKDTLKVAVHRFRKRYREWLREEIAQTVQTTSEIDEEMRYLVEVLRKH